MMYHTSALILKKEGWGEADWLVTALAPDFGKIRLLAQGSRKHGAKLQGHLEPGTIAEISFVIGRNGYRLTVSRCSQSFPATRASLPKLVGVATLLATLDANILGGSDQAAELFELAGSVLAAVEDAGEPDGVRRMLVWATLQLLQTLGLLPPLGVPEARGLNTLLALAAEPLARISQSQIAPDILEAELDQLARTLGRAVWSGPPVSAVAAALY